jgi:glycosyltransferase involved in cell wall biosynthesis
MNKPTIIITSPSLSIVNNVSGMSILTGLLIDKNELVNYSHFIVGKKDSQHKNMKWLLSQFILIFNFIKKLHNEKEVQIIHINIPLSKLSIFINLLLIIISKIGKLKIIVSVHGGALSLNVNVSLIQKYTIQKCLTLANKIIVLGEKESVFVSKFYNIDVKKIDIIPNSVEVTPSFVIKDIPTCKNNTILKIIFIGRIDREKGLEEILLSLKYIESVVNYHFYLAGSGPDQVTFVSKCFDSLGDKFSYVGVLNGIEKVHFFQDADVFVLPSYFEGLPISLLESMAYGVVPITTPVGSIPEVVIENRNGFIVPLNDYKSIAEKIIMLHNDRFLLKQMGQAAYETIVSSYSIDKYIEKLNTIYYSLLID